ncbi:hypothetical protein AAFF_G00158360 [Aldrovandia affinis]|uniref:Uncharacterized protein n=1 Tax=Aldrovandia affinis TaxID=143900 RepID=A0AAD7RNJ4_9TELE|nr:hypothetical protein AAFF_G00158360 [Aldrovandia affinis]
MAAPAAKPASGCRVSAGSCFQSCPQPRAHPPAGASHTETGLLNSDGDQSVPFLLQSPVFSFSAAERGGQPYLQCPPDSRAGPVIAPFSLRAQGLLYRQSLRPGGVREQGPVSAVSVPPERPDGLRTPREPFQRSQRRSAAGSSCFTVRGRAFGSSSPANER